MNSKQLPLCKDMEGSEHRHFNCYLLWFPSSPLWLCGHLELKVHTGIFGVKFGPILDPFCSSLSLRFPRSIWCFARHFFRPGSSWLCEAGLWIGAHSGRWGKQVKRSRKHPHFYSLSATLIQNALWKKHFEHHSSYTCQSSTVWDPE